MNDIDTKDFIARHLNDDVRELALGNFPAGIDKMFVLNQIQARQLLSKKVPAWVSNTNTLFPKHLSIEQCSSQQTADFKRIITRELTTGKPSHFADLTGGLGVDSYFISENFNYSYYVERDAELCRLAENNFKALGKNICVVNDDAQNFLSNLTTHLDLIFLDPARRDGYNRKMVSLHDCSPDVVKLQELMSQKASFILVKTSPMLDVSLITKELRNVSDMYFVAVKNECKETLVLIENGFEKHPRFHCVNILHNDRYSTFDFEENDEQNAVPILADSIKKYLYEPNAALMKAGAFKLVSQRFGIEKLHANSHLYTSDNLVHDFPGRIFSVRNVLPFNKKTKNEVSKLCNAASVAVRNFPLDTQNLRKKLGLKDGDTNFIFGTTSSDNRLVLLLCEKLSL
ncbi:MAG: class I SAM-dependent methyltransferase [Candidatus Limimorpha sp.]